MLKTRFLALSALALAAAGCASDPYYGSSYNDPRYGAYSRPAYTDVAYNEDGRVVAIDVVRGSGHASGGGAVAGNEIEKRHNDNDGYRIVVQFPDGREATFMQDSPNGLRVGDRVRIDGGRVYRY